ncbi:putative cytosine specific DNA methyltransferase replication foci [Lyophyllum shimeji]|uniref:DNA (cytosine-5)-methyltransferase n=1 Tax=Lyophyllum shimeji TaxID=47721 RepID=A0A9P3UKV9_LYOSH|nr:putative cytosine specific DNA methyltransferase replication foci [Lyophyllum shimeji]
MKPKNWYIEITTLPPKLKARERSPSPTSTEPASPTPAPRKKRKANPIAEARTGIPISPTVSDFEDTAVTYEPPTVGLPASPTVSDFATYDAAELDTPIFPRDKEIAWSGPPSSYSLSTRGASGSNVTPEAVPITLEESEASRRYEVADDEILEDDNLIIPGETVQDRTDGSTDGYEDTIPVRLLRDFTIYDASTNILVPVAELLRLEHSRQKFGASGLAKPWIEDEEDEDQEEEEDSVEEGNDAERVKLSTILAFDIHFCDAVGVLDSKIYIRTKHAWYILDMPSDQYRPLFVPFWIQHRVLHLLVTAAIKTPRISYDKFLEGLEECGSTDADAGINPPNEDFVACLRMLGRTLTKNDFELDDVRAYVISTLPDICKFHRTTVKSSRLLRSYFGEAIDLYEDSSLISPCKSRRKHRRAGASQHTDREREVLRHRNTTVVTPVVSRIAKYLFKGSLEVAGSFAMDDADVATEMDQIQVHHADPASMIWGHDDPEEGMYFRSVIMDGVEYFVGDHVMVNPGYDEDCIRARNAKTDAAQSANSYANRLWFCKICYFFEDRIDGKAVKMFHGQWFIHGSQTILQETAHSKTLFLLFECADNPTASIFKKCNVKIMEDGDPEVLDDAKPNTSDFYCPLVYNQGDAEFVSIPSEAERDQILSALPSYIGPCLSCGVERCKEALRQVKKIPSGFSHHGVNYHHGDFVYIRPASRTGLLEIAQITSIVFNEDHSGDSSIIVNVRHFGRHDDYVRDQNHMIPQSWSGLSFDERCLYRKTKVHTLSDPSLIEGVCYVRQLKDPDEINEWVQHEDHFYVTQEEDEDDNNDLRDMDEDSLKSCLTCYANRVERLRQDQLLLRNNGPIASLELFAGAGGLGTGMALSGFVDTKYAVEFSPSAAATFQANHPDATVYCQDSSLLLKHAIETDAGQNPKPLISNDGRTQLPRMPKKNSIGLIFGGAPCQSFSRANHNPRPDDIRSTLPGNMLSYVEFYNPDYFLLENVAGMINYRLLSTHGKNGRSLEGGIESGMVKFIMRSLIALGYQVRFKLLQAAQYGAPQSRRRVIFWGAKRGLSIPDFPVPIYASPKGGHRTKLPTGNFIRPVSRSLDPDDDEYHQCAPLRAITVDDAINDLVPFDWINPHDIIPAKERDKEEARRRRKEGIRQFHAVTGNGYTDLPGFPEGAAYTSEPKNRYQRWLRQEMGGTKVQGHYTRTFASRLVEATTTVPLRPWASHKDLPLKLQPNHAKPGTKQAKKSFYGRMDGGAQFKCAMTHVAPNVKESWVLHPTQKRILSVRECARAQGFPDHYEFKSVDDKPHKRVANQIRQIGNAVPVPLALHLGKALGKALLKEWEKDAREGSPAY